MKPPACVRCKWGTGTTCERPSNTVNAKEVQSNFEKMMAERTRQDSQWFAQEISQTNNKKEDTTKQNRKD